MIFIFAVVAGGLGLYPSIKITFLIFGFSTPIYWFLSRPSLKFVSLTLALFLSLVATTIIGSFLFAFTPISSSGTWLLIIVALTLMLMTFVFTTDKRRTNKKMLTSQEKFGITATSLFVLPAAYILNLSYPVGKPDPYWLPDDFPFFAILANDVSNGINSETFFSGLSINYHWLTYAFFGGVNRVGEIGQLQGLVVVPAVLGWLLLALGAMSIVQIFTRQRSAIVLSVLAVLFANSVGLATYSTSSLGGTVVSPSTLLTSSWFVAIVLLTHMIFKANFVRFWLAPLMLLLGFSLGLGKISTAVITAIGISLMVGFNCTVLRPRPLIQTKNLLKATIILVFPFIIGIGIVRIKFLSSTETPLGLEGSLFAVNDGNLILWLVAILPAVASVFSFLAMVAPTFLPYGKRIWNDLAFASAFLALFGLTVIFVFDFGSGNEAWFLVASLALILPTSAVVVTQLLSEHLSGRSMKRILQIIFAVGVPFASSLVILHWSGNSILEVRPWLLPGILCGIFLLFGCAYVMLGSSFGQIPSTREIVAIGIAGMFLLSIVFGMLLRTELLNISLQGRQGISTIRDNWLSESQQLARTSGLIGINTPLAIYSATNSEATLTRWIPYFLSSRAYNLNPNDTITDYFTPKDVFDERQAVVRSFVENANLQACQSLVSDGVEWVWVTQGLEIVDQSRVKPRSPRLIKVECSSLN